MKTMTIEEWRAHTKNTVDALLKRYASHTDLDGDPLFWVEFYDMSQGFRIRHSHTGARVVVRLDWDSEEDIVWAKPHLTMDLGATHGVSIAEFRMKVRADQLLVSIADELEARYAYVRILKESKE